MVLAAGQVLQNRYRVVSLLGQGGMGAVYRAWDTRLSIPVALKEMIPQPGLAPSMLAQLRQQFQQEATILARLDHPHLVNVTDFFEEAGNAYLVMKFIEGENLARSIEQGDALPETQVLEWADQLLNALAYCHAQGVIHRDVKPQNVIIRPDGQAVLVDFGLVKLWDPGDPHTRTAMRGMGTPEYAPPEQYDVGVGHTDQRSDIYSLGATLYHALTGHVPPTATRRIASREAFQPPRMLNQRISPATETAILRAMELTISDRFSTAQNMAAALRGGAIAPARRTFVSRNPATNAVPATQVATPPRKRAAGWVWAVGGIGVLAVGVVLAGVVGLVLLSEDRGQSLTGDTSTPTATSVETGTTSGADAGTALPLPSLVPRHVPPECTYNAYRLGWVLDYGDANSILNDVFHPDASSQHTFWDQQAFRDLVDQALLEPDSAARVGLWQQAEDILVTDYAVVVPIFHYDQTSLVQPDIQAEFATFGTPCFAKWRRPQGENTLRVRLSADPATLDVSTATDTDDQYVLNQLMEGLYRYTGEGTIEPAGARSFDVSRDGMVYTVHLRTNATWSDLEKVVAQHYVDGIMRLLDPDTGAGYAWVMYPIRGAEAYNTGETSDPSTVGVRAVDNYTLEITLERPASYFEAILALPTTYPVRLDVIAAHGDEWTEPGNFVGNGPYELSEWVHDDHLTLRKKNFYHDASAVTIERIEFPIIAEDVAALAAYERSELDVSGYPREELPRILDEMESHLTRMPYPGVYYLGLNTGVKPTSNLNFRKALASSIDKRAIVDRALNMPWRVEACSVIPPEVPGYRGCGGAGYVFDVEAAQQYLESSLEEMNVERSSDITVDLWFNQGNESVIEAIAGEWESNLGINVNLVSMDWGAYLDALGECGGDR
jgi:ABC-type oligopeptide transport system substrate-binding subunit/serine/threonine protein kinase